MLNFEVYILRKNGESQTTHHKAKTIQSLMRKLIVLYNDVEHLSISLIY